MALAVLVFGGAVAVLTQPNSDTAVDSPDPATAAAVPADFADEAVVPGGSGVCAASAPDGGPSTPPQGARVIESGSEPADIVSSSPAGATFWFAPGTHTFGRPIETRNSDTYVGAPGAVLVGSPGNASAFAGDARDVTLSYLRISDFASSNPAAAVNSAAVNRSVGDGWVVDSSSFTRLAGAALFMGDDSVVRNSCFDSNSQYGVSVPSRFVNGEPTAIENVSIEGSEFVGNNPDDLEGTGACRGCTGAMKLWMPRGVTIVDNHIHGNHGPGVWVDTNGVDIVVDDNLIEANDRAGVFIEISYNARIRHNTFVGNAVAAGTARGRGATFPDAAVYVSESGGADGLGELPGRIDIVDNLFVDNWNGVTLWENANRFCSSSENTSEGYCTLTGGTIDECADAASTDSELFLNRCRWRTRRVGVRDNTFVLTPAFECPAPTCGRNSLIADTFDATVSVARSNGEVSTPRIIAPADSVRRQIVESSDNNFESNVYRGSWAFSLGAADRVVDAQAWSSEGFDSSSTFG